MCYITMLAPVSPLLREDHGGVKGILLRVDLFLSSLCAALFEGKSPESRYRLLG